VRVQWNARLDLRNEAPRGCEKRREKIGAWKVSMVHKAHPKKKGGGGEI